MVMVRRRILHKTRNDYGLISLLMPSTRSPPPPNLGVHVKGILVAFILFLIACLPFQELAWFKATVLFPITNCYPTCEFQVYLHPFTDVLLYSSDTRYVHQFPFKDANIQACLIITVIFSGLTSIFSGLDNLCVDIVLTTITLIFAAIGLGLWQTLPLINSSVIPFYNVTLTYTGRYQVCYRRGSCKLENDFDVVFSNYSRNITELSVVNSTSRPYVGWIFWVVALSILSFTYLGMLIYKCLSRGEIKFKEEIRKEERKEKEQYIILT